MYQEQRLETCEGCAQPLALEYRWPARRAPSASDRVALRTFACPACRHANPFLTLYSAFAFRLKLLPGPHPGGPARANAVRRLLLSPLAAPS